MEHYHGHQQALIKDNVCVVALSFSEHDETTFEDTFKKFDHDYVVDMCSVFPRSDQDPLVGAYWNGKNFLWNPYPSWVFNKELGILQAPSEPPYKITDEENERWGWDETTKTWVLEKKFMDPYYVNLNCCEEGK